MCHPREGGDPFGRGGFPEQQLHQADTRWDRSTVNDALWIPAFAGMAIGY
jgi:hypothetical protein